MGIAFLGAVIASGGRDALGAGMCPEFTGGTTAGFLDAPEINELSGLAASRRHPGVWWVHNDSGDSARIFAIDAEGRLLGIYRLAGLTMLDYEDIAVGPGPEGGPDWIYVGDIGDNGRNRSSIAVHRVAEPEVDPEQESVSVDLPGAELLPMVYPGGDRFDAETLLADPVNGDLYVVTKDGGGSSGVFRYAAPPEPGVTRVLEKVADLRFGAGGIPSADVRVTGGDIRADGAEILLRTYADAFLWPRSAGEDPATALSRPPCAVSLRIDAGWPQGEAIGFEAVGGEYRTASEGVGPPLVFYERFPHPSPIIRTMETGGGGTVVIGFEETGWGVSSYRLESLVGNSPGDGAWIEDPSAAILQTNPGWFEATTASPGAQRVFYRIAADPEPSP